MDVSDVIASISAVISVGSVTVAFIAVRASDRFSKLIVQIAKRQGIIDLHVAWSDIHQINCKSSKPVHIAKAVNALGLTATLWNHDVIEKSILYQNYWESFKDIYDELYKSKGVIPSLNKTGHDLLTKEIKRAYGGMENADIESVITSEIRGT